MGLAARVAFLSTLTSAFLAVLKILVGASANSASVVSDGVESAADVLTSGLVYFAVRLASKPADEDHPYGHGRVDILAGLGVGVVLFAAGMGICWRSLVHNLEVPALYAVWPLLISIVLKCSLSITKLRVGRASGSEALIADARNDAVDIASGAIALIAVLLSIFRPGWSAADHWGGFLIGLIVLFLGLRTIYETAMHLMDTMPAPEQMEQIRRTAISVPGALGVEKCFARKTGSKYHVDLHLEVDPQLTVLESHDIATEVRDHLRSQLNWVADVLVHVEPHLPQEEYGKSRNRAASQ